MLATQGSGAGDLNGNFSPGDHVILVRADSLTLSFDEGISSIGAQIAANFYGPFIGGITAYDGASLLGSFTEMGDSTDANDGSAIFLGFVDMTGADITSVVFTYTSGAPQGLLLDTLKLNDSLPVAAPESGILSLLLLGIGCLTLWRRRGWVQSN